MIGKNHGGNNTKILTVEPKLIANVNAKIVMADGYYDSFNQNLTRNAIFVEFFFQKLKLNHIIINYFAKLDNKLFDFIHTV